MIVRDSDYLTKDEIRAALPLEFVLAWYGRALNDQGRTICPWHDDTNPSLGLWTGDDGVVRYACHACSPQRHGDIYDFIMDIEGITRFTEAVNRARDILEHLPPDYAPTVTPEPKRVDPAQMAYVVDGARTRAKGDGWMAISTKLVRPPQTDEELANAKAVDRYLQEYWGWGLTPEGYVLMPHWDAEGQVTGAKIRTNTGRRWSLEGSSYLAALYGAWLPRNGRDYFIAEGETDAVWAAYEAHRLRMPLNVRALPSGAGAEPNGNWEGNLRGARTIYLCFDADDAGVAATEAWLEFLQSMGYPDVKVCKLPLGLDLRDTRPDLETFLARAIRPDRFYAERLNLHILKAGDTPIGYGRFRRGQDPDEPPKPISTWHLQPQALLRPMDDDIQLPNAISGLITARGQEGRDVISGDDLSSLRKLKDWTEPRLLGFTGADADVSALRDYLFDRASYLPEVFQTGRVGLHDAPANYHYLGRTLAYPGGWIGRLPWEIVPAKRIANLDGLTTFEHGPRNLDWLYHFLVMNEGAVMQPILAWLAAAARRTEVRDFPLIFLGGSSGAGKSTIARIGCELFGSRATVHLGQATGFVLMSYLASTTTVPIFVDEWTLKSREDARLALQGSIPAIYEGSTAYRGTADQSLVAYRMTAPTMIAGEDAFQMERELERTIVLNLNRDAQNYPALQQLVHQPLGHFAHAFYTWLVAQPPGSLPQFPADAPTRPAYNRAVLQTGWDTIRAFLDAAAQFEPVPQLPPTLDYTLVDRAQEERSDSYEDALRIGMNLQDGARRPLVWEDERGTWLRANELVTQLQRHADIELPGKARALKRHFETKGYQIDDTTYTHELATSSVRATLIAGLHLDNEEGT